jgi:hypothetical protein
VSATQTIIVGGGIQSGAPFTLNHLVYITNTTPPQISSYGAQRLVDSVSAAEYTSIPTSAAVYLTNALNATEGLRVNGGAILAGTGGTGTSQLGFGALAAGTDATAIGRGASAPGTDQIAIGRAATTRSGAGPQIAIGQGAIMGNTFGNQVVIGATANGSGSTGVVIGFNAGAGTAVLGVIIGESAQAAGNGGGVDVVVIGSGALALMGSNGGGGCVLIGTAGVANHPSCVVIGRGAQASKSNSVGQINVVIGDGALSAGTNTTIVGGSSGVTGDASDVVVIGALSTTNVAGTGGVVIGSGNAVTHGQNLILGNGNTSIAANTAWIGGPTTDLRTFIFGAGNQFATPAARTIRFTDGSGANNAAGAVTIQTPRSSGNATPSSFIFQATTAHGSDSVLQTLRTVFQLDLNGALFPLDGGIFFTNQTDAAAAGAGTLLNAPQAGNPVWLRVNRNGTAGAVPWWPL